MKATLIKGDQSIRFTDAPPTGSVYANTFVIPVIVTWCKRFQDYTQEVSDKYSQEEAQEIYQELIRNDYQII